MLASELRALSRCQLELAMTKTPPQACHAQQHVVTSTCSIQTGKSRQREQKALECKQLADNITAYTSWQLDRELASPVGQTVRTRPRSSKLERGDVQSRLQKVFQQIQPNEAYHAASLLKRYCNQLARNAKFTRRHGRQKGIHATRTGRMAACTGRTNFASERRYFQHGPA
ncbi:hypothetical protein ABBQ38_001030 [Trebouxia sp. C0009 RCD-2024]